VVGGATGTGGGGSSGPTGACGATGATGGPAPPPSVGQGPSAPLLALGCSATCKLALTDVLRRGGHVLIDGVADPSLAGKKVTILLARKRIKRVRVGASGFFTTRVLLPRARVVRAPATGRCSARGARAACRSRAAWC